MTRNHKNASKGWQAPEAQGQSIATSSKDTTKSEQFGSGVAPMTAAHVYETCRIKRNRASRAEMDQRKHEILKIVREIKPCTVRQCFYQCEIRGIVEKTEAGYDRVQRALVEMRRAGELPYGWIADNTRWQRKPNSFNDPAAAIEEAARFYRKALWADAGRYVECWLEKDALSGVVWPVTDKFDVPLMVSRGYASLSFLHSAAECIASLDVPAYIYHLGDFDPSGVNAAEKIESTLRELAPDAEIHFERLAVLPDQIERLALPTRPTKTTDSRSKGFAAESVELDAIHPDLLRRIVSCAIEEHLPEHQYKVLMVAEESERQFLQRYARLAAREAA
jgi:hypothetical protein